MALVAGVARIQLLVATLALVVMGTVTVADVFMKYVFSRPIAGAYDLVECLLPVVVFYGLPTVLLRRQNIVIDLVDHMAGPRGTRTLIAAADLVILLVLAMILWAAVGPALQAYDYGDRKLELGVPIFVVWIAVLIGLAGCVLVSLTMPFRSLRPAIRREVFE